MSGDQTRNEASGGPEYLIQGRDVNGSIYINSGLQRDDSERTDIAARDLRRGFGEKLADVIAGGRKRRLRTLARRLEIGFSDSVKRDDALARAAQDYRTALRLAFSFEPGTAAALHRAYDARIPAERYPMLAGDQSWLSAVADHSDASVLSVILELGTRLRSSDLQHDARDRLARVLAHDGDADLVVTHLHRWHELGILEPGTITSVVGDYVRRTPLEHDEHLWRSFLTSLPSGFLPELFKVRCFLGQGADAVRLSETPDQELEALKCCLGSTVLDDAMAGLELAHRRADSEVCSEHAAHAGDLLFHARRYEDALVAYTEAQRPARMSECHERLDQFFEALSLCPLDQLPRLLGLVARCRSEIDVLAERHEYPLAAARIKVVSDRLDEVGARTDELTRCRGDITSLRETLLAAGRLSFSRKVQRTESETVERSAIYATWSLFEEAAGELNLAAGRAEDAGELYRANRLFQQAGLYAEAVRVLAGDDSPQALKARAEANEAAGDLLGAARLYEQCGDHERAVSLYMSAEAWAVAAHCLTSALGDSAIEDPRTAECLRRARDFDGLVTLCLSAIKKRGRSSRGSAELRLLDEHGMLPPHQKTVVRELLAELGSKDRRRFEARAQAWVARARAEIDRRFSAVWGFDLGTTTCVAAIYDADLEKVVSCPWRGNPSFPSTFSLDGDLNELIGLSGEESLTAGLAGHIEAAKRSIGFRRYVKIRNRRYRPEEVSARFVRLGRALVENHLMARVRERVGEFAMEELGEVDEEWLAWADQNHDLRLRRSQAVVSIPAYFTNNQKHATRSACEIAGVEAILLIHEPTVACLAAARERGLSGSVAVVDLGAGTLDLSFVVIKDNIYSVKAVGGDREFGGRDLDKAIVGALVTQLTQQGFTSLGGRSLQRRLEVAAEALKVELSSQEQAEYPLPALINGKDALVSLSRSDLSAILSDQLGKLGDICTKFKAKTGQQPRYLVLIGGPMRSPMIRDVIERAFGMRRTAVNDPQLAVAHGAAVRAAMLDAKLSKSLLQDVTPLSLGIRVKDSTNCIIYSELIRANTDIPIVSTKTYTTRVDNQSAVSISIYNGSLETEAKIGQFTLSGIPPAPQGVPQIDVTFDIDESCILTVTAKDQATGNANSIRITDTTLLTPGEVSTMTARYRAQREQEEQRRIAMTARLEMAALITKLNTVSDDCSAAWREFRQRTASHRHGSAPLDQETQRTLLDLFSRESQLEIELESALREVPGLLSRACEHMARLEREESPDQETDTPSTTELGRKRAQLSDLLATLVRWNAALVTAAVAGPHPMSLFRSHHDSGNYLGAIQALEGLGTSPTDVRDIRRQLHCLAQLGESERYRTVLNANTELLHAVLLDPENPQAYVDRIRPALAQILAARPGTMGARGAGFLIAGRLVMTSRSWLQDTAGEATTPRVLQVEWEDDTAPGTTARESYWEERPRHPLVILRLADPIEHEPLRLGHSALVRIGAPVWVPESGDNGSPTLIRGVVEEFLKFPEQGMIVFKVKIGLPSGYEGKPLLNNLGEVVGVLAPSQHTDSVFAVAIDSVSDRLTEFEVER